MNEHYSITGARHLQLDGAIVLQSRRPKPGKLALLALLVLLVLGLVLGGALLWNRAPSALVPAPKSAPAATAQQRPADALADLPSPDLLRSLTTDEAVAANAERPIIKRADDPAAVFKLSGDAISKLRAIDCLTQAVYYEAASEGVDGGRAVAQVVLNRVRHPGYPNSVCGVVFEGSTRATGCQFSFTCDGSLARLPVAYLWARSRLIASQALAGRLFVPVGLATHYHANYVLPYWADSLDKVAVIGRHIFYRLRGSSGSGAAFSQRYAAAEAMPPLPPATEVIEQGMDAITQEPGATPLPELPKVEEDRLQTLDPAPTTASEAKEPLAADLSRGQLILGEPGPAAKPKRTSVVECGSGGASRIQAAGAADFKVGQAKTAC